MTKRFQPPPGAGLFGNAAPEEKKNTAAYRANIDGGSRGNPGPASYGVVVRDGRGEIVARLKKYIGRTTNNVAEYYGLIAALDYAQSKFERAKKMSQTLESFRIDHVYREQNAEADALANEAMDEVARGGSATTSSTPVSKSVPAATKKTAEPLRLTARYYRGLLKLENPLDLPDDAEVEILLRPKANS
jgi:ribonuclease HI